MITFQVNFYTASKLCISFDWVKTFKYSACCVTELFTDGNMKTVSPFLAISWWAVCTLSHEFTLAECGRKYGPRPDLAMSKELVDFPSGSDGKASVYNAGDPGSSPGLGRSPGDKNCSPLQYYCLENPMDRGAW